MHPSDAGDLPERAPPLPVMSSDRIGLPFA
jgi:hypothetical protein